MWSFFLLFLAVVSADARRNKSVTCSSSCPAIFEPVCALCPNGEETIFGNECELDRLNACDKHNRCTKRHDGLCESSLGCDRTCRAAHKPICALCEYGEQRTFGNECELNRQNACEPSIPCTKVRKGKCKPKCPVSCPFDYQPVCARCQDGNETTFGNRCELGGHNTCHPQNRCTQIHDGECAEVNVATVCPDSCAEIYQPVCAQCSGRRQTFSNACSLQQHRCQTGEECTQVKEGACQEPRIRPCPFYDVHVCAICNAGYHVFPNTCLMENFNCQRNDNCRNISEGVGQECPPRLSTGPIAVTTTPQPSRCDEISCLAIYEPVCARCNNQTKTFSSDRSLAVHNCRNTDECVKVRDGECRPCPVYKCSSDLNPICAQCGSEKRTFDNRCLFDSYNCPADYECTEISSGECQENPAQPAPVLCSTQRYPVCANCASGRRTFPNQCFLKSYQILNPQENCTKLNDGRCHTVCPLYNCLRKREEICALCGFEQRTFENECMFNAYNCPAGFECTKISDGPCSSNPPLICPGEYTPVCATCSYGLETFANSCFLNAHNLANPNARCVLKSEGPCTTSCPQLNCSNRASPVCGICGNQRLTFFNDCRFKSYNCNSGYACRKLAAGQCR